MRIVDLGLAMVHMQTCLLPVPGGLSGTEKCGPIGFRNGSSLDCHVRHLISTNQPSRGAVLKRKKIATD